MNPQATPHSQSWVTFTYASFLTSLAMVVAGILFMPLDTWIKGYFAMGVVMLVQSCITVTKLWERSISRSLFEVVATATLPPSSYAPTAPPHATSTVRSSCRVFKRVVCRATCMARS